MNPIESFFICYDNNQVDILMKENVCIFFLMIYKYNWVMKMKKDILVIGVVALFVGLALLPAEASAITSEPEKERPGGWEYFIVGRIKSYEIVDYNGTEYLECKAFRVNWLTWNILERFPKLPLLMNLRFGQQFNIPYEGANITGPTLLGHYFIIARGTL